MLNLPEESITVKTSPGSNPAHISGACQVFDTARIGKYVSHITRPSQSK
jgi:hypothetical protein